MSKKRLQQSNFWPGYVDALVNVVLNILFMVGLMAVGLVSLNLEAAANFSASKKVATLKEINEENMLLAALGTLVAAWGEIPEDDGRQLKFTARSHYESRTSEKLVQNKEYAVTAGSALKDLSNEARAKGPVEIQIKASGIAATAEEQYQLLRIQAAGKDSTDYLAIEFSPYFFELRGRQLTEIENFVGNRNKQAVWHVATLVSDNEQANREAFWRMYAVRQRLFDLGISSDRIKFKSFVANGTSFQMEKRVFITLALNG